MDQRELHLQPVGICYRVYHFIMKTLASQASKTVTLGRFGSTQVPTSSACSKQDKAVVQPETPCENHKELPPIHGLSRERGEEKNNPCMTNGETAGEKMAPREKAPKKMVSIKENVEEIIPNKKKKKRRKSFQKSNSREGEEGEEEEEEEIKPQRSILKVSSNLNEKSMSEC